MAPLCWRERENLGRAGCSALCKKTPLQGLFLKANPWDKRLWPWPRGRTELPVVLCQYHHLLTAHWGLPTLSAHWQEAQTVQISVNNG